MGIDEYEPEKKRGFREWRWLEQRKYRYSYRTGACWPNILLTMSMCLLSAAWWMKISRCPTGYNLVIGGFERCICSTSGVRWKRFRAI